MNCRGPASIGAALVASVCLAAGLAAPVRADVVKSIRLTSSPSGAKVYQLSAGHQTPICDATPCDWQSEFHSEQSVLRLRFELPGHAAVTQEVTPDRQGVTASLKMTNAAAAASAAQSPRLRALETRLNPAINESVRAAEANAGKAAKTSGPPVLREIGGRVYLWLTLAVMNLESQADSGNGGMVRAMWAAAGAGFDGTLRNRLAKDSIAGIIVDAAPGSASGGFTVSSQMESNTEMTCIPGTVMRYDSCASHAPDYTYRCYNGNCTSFQSGSHCVGGRVPQYDACATRAPITKYQVKVNPQSAIKPSGTQANRPRLIAVSDWSGKTEPALIQTDTAGRITYVNGPEPSAAVKQAFGLAWPAAVARKTTATDESVFNEAATFFARQVVQEMKVKFAAKGDAASDAVVQTINTVETPLAACMVSRLESETTNPELKQDTIRHYQAVRAGKATLWNDDDGMPSYAPLFSQEQIPACLDKIKK